MQLSPALPQPRSRTPSLALRALMAVAAACLAVVGAASAVVIGVRLTHAGRALPGVTAAGVNVSGMTEGEIQVALGSVLTFPENGLVVFSDGDKLWTAKPADLGLVMDIPSMSAEALQVGRQGSLIDQLGQQAQAWFSGHTIAPHAILDQRVGANYLQGIAAQIDQPVREASVSTQGIQIQMVPGQIGRRLDIPATLAILTPSLVRLYDTDLELVVEESLPQVLDASQEAEIARRILSAPLTLTAEGAGPWTVQPEQLAQMMHFDLVTDGPNSHYEVAFDLQPLDAMLQVLVPELLRKAENARFIFNDDTRQLDLLKPAVIGRQLDVPATLQAVTDGLKAGQHELPLVFTVQTPEVTDDKTAADLGITEAVSVVSTYFSGSSPERIHNIKTAAAAFHGLLIPPGGTLSMADVLGEVSLDTGYAEAWVIVGTRTVKGAGGGVCQVSTTLFRTAFFGGFDIVERYPHAYRVGYYEQGPNSPGPGFDAAVFLPRADFKFTNDSPYWLLMETYVYNNRQLQWKFYSTSDGREVSISSSGPANVVEAAPPLYQENPALAAGEIRQVDWEADGMDVTVWRTVTRNGEVIHRDTIKTRYQVWRAIFEYGPGTTLPEGAATE